MLLLPTCAPLRIPLPQYTPKPSNALLVLNPPPPLAKKSDEDGNNTTPRASGGGRMQELLASYYGIQRGTDRSSDVESTSFDSKAYVRGLLKNEKVETLLRKDDDMVRIGE